ncbi:MAG: hypothetical protein KDA37_14070, partial [Planctomycetales bacterium]|nr:hypothetical protein [Planctomycetales bacterium]
ERLALIEGASSAVYGAGYSESGVYEFVSNLGAMPGASNVALQETGVRQGAEGPSTSFNLTADLNTTQGASTQEARHE